MIRLAKAFWEAILRFNDRNGFFASAHIAMAMMLDPQLIIADEPTTALDVTIQSQIFDLMTSMKANDSSILLITHDMGVIWEMCDRVIVMYASRIVEQGPVKSVFEKPIHPYTQSLLKSMPQLSQKVKRELYKFIPT